MHIGSIKHRQLYKGEKNINLRSVKPKLSIRQVCRLNHNFAQQLKKKKSIMKGIEINKKKTRKLNIFSTKKTILM